MPCVNCRTLLPGSMWDSLSRQPSRPHKIHRCMPPLHGHVRVPSMYPQVLRKLPSFLKDRPPSLASLALAQAAALDALDPSTYERAEAISLIIITTIITVDLLLLGFRDLGFRVIFVSIIPCLVLLRGILYGSCRVLGFSALSLNLRWPHPIL